MMQTHYTHHRVFYFNELNITTHEYKQWAAWNDSAPELRPYMDVMRIGYAPKPKYYDMLTKYYIYEHVIVN